MGWNEVYHLQVSFSEFFNLFQIILDFWLLICDSIYLWWLIIRATYSDTHAHMLFTAALSDLSADDDENDGKIFNYFFKTTILCHVIISLFQ